MMTAFNGLLRMLGVGMQSFVIDSISNFSDNDNDSNKTWNLIFFGIETNVILYILPNAYPPLHACI